MAEQVEKVEHKIQLCRACGGLGGTEKLVPPGRIEHQRCNFCEGSGMEELELRFKPHSPFIVAFMQNRK